VFFTLCQQLPDGLSASLSDLRSAGKLDALLLDSDFSKTTTIWAGILAMTLYHTTGYGANQMIVQRTLGAKNIGDAKKSFLLMGYLAFFIYFFFILLGILFYHYYGGKTFDNTNTIILEFISTLGIPGLMGLVASAVIAASMSSLDSAFNAMSTVSVLDFYQKYIRPDANEQHYLRTTKYFTLAWAILIVIPAILYSTSSGSVLELVGKIGSYFVGAKLSMYFLGFYSKHTSERGLLIGVFAGMLAVAWGATFTTIAWPWYCLIGAGINIPVSIGTSILLDGWQKDWSPHSIPGQKDFFAQHKLPQQEKGWYVMPGKVDTSSYGLLLFFVANLCFLYWFRR
ncbi:MAG: sodium transporter, partial [Bacteroidota bacterium]